LPGVPTHMCVYHCRAFAELCVSRQCTGTTPLPHPLALSPTVCLSSASRAALCERAFNSCFRFECLFLKGAAPPPLPPPPPLLLFAYVGPVCSAAARRDSVLYLPTDIHSLLVTPPPPSPSPRSNKTKKSPARPCLHPDPPVLGGPRRSLLPAVQFCTTCCPAPLGLRT